MVVIQSNRKIYPLNADHHHDGFHHIGPCLPCWIWHLQHTSLHCLIIVLWDICMKIILDILLFSNFTHVLMWPLLMLAILFVIFVCFCFLLCLCIWCVYHTFSCKCIDVTFLLTKYNCLLLKKGLLVFFSIFLFRLFFVY